MKKVREREANKEKISNEKSQPLKAVDKFQHVESKVKDLMIVSSLFKFFQIKFYHLLIN